MTIDFINCDNQIVFMDEQTNLLIPIGKDHQLQLIVFAIGDLKFTVFA